MPYYKVDYGENDPELIYTVLVELPDIVSLRNKLTEFREPLGGQNEDSIDEFVEWLNANGVKAEIVEVQGTLHY